MKRRKKDDKYHQMAVLAFILVVVVALGAFYTMWQGGVGKSYIGLKAYGEIEAAKKGLSRDVQVVVKRTTKEICCCESRGGRALEAYIPIPKEGTEEEQNAACMKYCEEDQLTKGMGLGHCYKYGLSYDL